MSLEQRMGSNGCGAKGAGTRGRGGAGLGAAALVAGVVIALWGGAGKAEAQNVGLRLGYNNATMSMQYSNFSDDKLINNKPGWQWNRRGSFNSSFGYHVGLSFDMPISEVEIKGIEWMFGLNPSVMFVSKGGKNTKTITYSITGYPDGTAEYTIDAYYLDIPVPLSLKRELSPGFSWRVEFGPYLAIGLFGEQNLKLTTYAGNPGPGPVYTQDAFHEEGLNRIDGGLFYGVALEFAESVFLAIRAGSSLVDDNNVVYVTLGYNIRLGGGGGGPDYSKY